jgi:ATP-dependent RNA helicase
VRILSLRSLCDIYKQLNINQALIYCNKRQRAEWLAGKMSSEGFPLSYIHGEMDVDERRKRMQSFQLWRRACID